MALVGGLAGLVCWTVQVWLSDYLPLTQEKQWLLVLIHTTVMGVLIGGLTVGFADRWTSDRVMPRWVAMGVFLGAGAGILSGVLYIPVFQNMIQDSPSPSIAFVGRLVAWLLTGGLIGFVVGLRWFGVNKFRAFHAMAGGMLGGSLGGLIFSSVGQTDLLQALAFVISGVGICLGVTLAPMLLRDGVLQFISSGDPRAQNKYGSPRQEWVIQDGDRFVLGSLGANATMTSYSRDVQMYLPDAMVAARHAVLFGRAKRFYVQLHPDNISPGGQPLSPLLIGNVSVMGTREIQDGDDILLGQTLLRFRTRKRQAEVPQYKPNYPVDYRPLERGVKR